MAASSTEMLMNADGLVVNAYHDATGRGDYFPGSSGTSEGQFLFIIGNLRAYKATGNLIAKELAERALMNILKVTYRNLPIPDVVDVTHSFAPHWLFNVKYPFDSSVIYYDRTVEFTAGVGFVNSTKVRYAYNARSLDSTLLWENPYSTLKTGTSYAVASTEYVAGQGQKVTLATPYTGSLFLTYSEQVGLPVQVNEPFEAWPDWRKLEPGEIACAVDVFVWAYRAFTLAAEVFNNPTWAAAARATKEQAKVAFDLNDARDWLKPTWTKNPFASGSRFSASFRVPAPVYSVDGQGNVLLRIQGYVGGGDEVQYGNASVGDHYGLNDVTTIDIGATLPVTVVVFIDLFQAYAEVNRYFYAANLKGDGMQTLVLRRANFKNSSGATIPVDAPVYTFGVSSRNVNPHTVMIGRVRQTPARKVPYYPGAIPFTANFQGNPAQLIDWRGPIYMGYQSPYMWNIVNNGDTTSAKTNVKLLADAQAQWKIQTGQPRTGPFAPVYIFDRPDAVQYGTPDTFTWEGPDPNTRWAGYQYRPIIELVESATGLSPNSPLRIDAFAVAGNFLDWLAADWPWLPFWATWVDVHSKTIEDALGGFAAPPPAPVFPALLPFGPPTDYPRGAAEINYPEPHLAALILRAVVLWDEILRPNGDADGAMLVPRRALIHKCMAVLSVLWKTEGQMAGTFSPDPAKHEWYGFWHGEILDTLGIVVTWGERPGVNRPAVAEQARIWIDGMLRWAKTNVLPPVNPYGAPFMWRFQHNWSEPVTESFEFSTTIYEAFTGKEQRMSNRIEPRRRLSVRHSLAANEAQAYDAVLRLRQNKPMMIPQWHLARPLLEDAPVGQSFLLVDTTELVHMPWGQNVAITLGSTTIMLIASAIYDNRVVLAQPLEIPIPTTSIVVPMTLGLLDQDVSATRRTSTVVDALMGFRLLPQDDFRKLPKLPAPMLFTNGADSREVILTKPNWSSDPSVGQTWEFNVTEYDNGPVVPISGRDKGARTVQARWTLNGLDAINAHLGLVARLHGRRYACWLPSWTHDFVLTRDITNLTRLTIEPNVFIDLGLMTDPSVGIFVRLFDGTVSVARVSSVITGSQEYIVVLDRPMAALASRNDVAMISVLYRVRQVSDTTNIKWLSSTVAETAAAFVSVFNETN